MGKPQTSPVRLYGDPPRRIILLHGGPGAAGEMSPVAQELEDTFGIVEKLQTMDSIDGQVAELAGVCTDWSLPPVMLVGYSWGAWLGILCAARNPALVAKLILLSCAPIEERYVARMTSVRMQRLTPLERNEISSLSERLSDTENSVSISAFRRLGRICSRADSFELIDEEDGDEDSLILDPRIFQRVWPEAAAFRRSGELLDAAAAIRCPVTAIHGTDDPHPAAGVRDPLARLLPDARFIMLDRCGHTPWRERYARGRFFSVLRAELGREEDARPTG